ncbi:hypothetical protein EDC01DRAFT_41493 [Geopyxis carbonaria]|nr:hypothetical protein EDC01DRAFT_41493 [Geopyxis carbonaria]
MATVNPTPWESRDRKHSFASTTQTLPPITALNGSAPSNDPRDSGNWSLASTSQRASNISEVSQPPLTLPPIDGHSTRNSPGENGHPSYSQTHSPVSTGFGASTTSLHATSQGNHYPSHTTPEGVLPTPSPSASRRSSFDSRLQNLQLSSPVGGTPAASQVSLSSTLLNSNRDSLTSQMQRERGIHSNSPCPPHLQNHDNSSNPFSSHRPSDMMYPNGSRANATPARTAPPIAPIKHGYGQASHPNAPVPTKGLPWAFPDPDIAIDETRPSHEGGVPGRTSTSSLPGSAASSIYSTNSGLVPPHGQSQMPSMIDINGHMPRNPLPLIAQDTHHHGIVNRRPSLVGHDQCATPYSRTPELRVSHKLAERKRRKEMKELFDELRDSLPAERGGKSSKWEVLTKAIEFVQHQKNTISDKDLKIEQMQHQMEQQQKDLDAARNEVNHFRAMQHSSYHHPPPPQHQPPPPQHGEYHPPSNEGYHPQSNGPQKMQGMESC